MKYLNLVLFFVLATFETFAGNFTSGNLVVIRVGNGQDTLTNAAQPVFLDEYTTGGILVQSIALPDTESGNNHILTLTGTSTSEGALTLSANGQYLSLAGYDAVPGYPAVASDSAINRTIARIGADGVPNTTTGFLAATAYKKSNIRGSVTNDGSGFWCSGTSSSSTGGTYYLPFGSFASSPVHVSTSTTNTRVINIFDGQLYTSTGSAPFIGVNAVGTGLPVANGQPTVNLPGLSVVDSGASPYGFYFFDMNPDVPGYDVLYVCDEHTNAPAGGIYKYSLVGGTWVSNGNVPNSSALRGLTGYQSCSSVTLFASSQSDIFQIRDTTGYNQPIEGALYHVVGSASNTVFRGIAFTPGTTPPVALVAAVFSAQNVSCNGKNNGSINLSVSGGLTPYSYQWSDADTIGDRTALGPGNYAVTVSDASGCSASASASISEPSAISVSANVTNLPCTGVIVDTGAIAITVSGGVAPYSFLWSNNQTTQNINNLDTGTFTVIVTDTTSCSDTFSATVSATGNLLVNPTVTPVSCHGFSDGAITTAPTGGTPGYSFAWSNDSTTQNISNLTAGLYTVTVKDTLGCALVNTIDVQQPLDLTYSTTITNANCYDDTSGVIITSVHGGTYPYYYFWSDSSRLQNLTGVSGGSYTLTVTDSHACVLTVSATINQPDSIALTAAVSNATGFGVSDGGIVLNISGGTPGFSYSWSNLDSTQNISGLMANMYCVTVTDDHSCQQSACFDVNQPPTGIQETGFMEKFVMYQSGDNLFIDAQLKSDMEFTILLYDITGKIIFQGNPEVNTLIQKQISFSQFPSGYYLIRILTKQGSISKKAIIVK